MSHSDYIIDEKEAKRLKLLLHYEEAAFCNGFKAVAGIDEAGRGPLAGPVVAAACLVPKETVIPYINDSKKLTPLMRQRLYQHIVQDLKLCYAVGIVEAPEIDRINIYQATIQAMLLAIERLTVQPDYLLVDGMHVNHPLIPCLKIIKGDSLSQSIAAASIIAKETRDALMGDYHQRWPQYGFNQHKGYGTPQHLKAIEEHGPCEIHRYSFAPIKNNPT